MRIVKSIFPFFCIFVFLIFHEVAILGAQKGLLLWYRTILPTLLPFIILTNLILNSDALEFIICFLSPLSKRLQINPYCMVCILIGLLCGYPIGGKIINDLYQKQKLSFEESIHLLPVCNNASPMFLVGYVHTFILKYQLPLFVLLSSVYLPQLIFYVIKNRKINYSYNYIVNNHHNSNPYASLNTVLLHAIQIIVMIGCYIMLFSIGIEIIKHCIHSNMLMILISYLEITNGLSLLNTVCPVSLKYPLILSLTTFGGFCSAYQVKSVLTCKEFKIKRYILDKLSLSVCTFLLALLYQYVTLKIFV